MLYFWVLAREGSLARASSELRLAQSTISKQIHQFEDMLGHSLFTKRGRRLVLTESGRVAYRYADEIFCLGRELLDTMRDRPVGKPITVTVGIADVVPKLVVERVLSSSLILGEQVRLICKEGKPDRLLADLALHDLDVILADAPANPNVNVRAYNHLLGESAIVLLGSRTLAAESRLGFPHSLSGLPVLLPTDNTALRRNLEQWFDVHGIRPNVVGEFEDSALMMTFGGEGAGIFPSMKVLSRDVEKQYGVECIGEVADLCERLYAVTVERRIKHPTVVAICEFAKSSVFRSVPLAGGEGRARKKTKPPKSS